MANTSTQGSQQAHPQAIKTLPNIGMSRWGHLRHFIPISRESWRKLVVAGKAPAPVKLSERCTMYSNGEVHRWLADPANYQAKKVGA
jgi:predicted DNA-binding transcriptional regulator AlpA